MAHGGKVQGILIHSLTDAAGMPLAHRKTSANGHERAQVLPLLDAVCLRTGKPGRPRKRPKVLAIDKGYDAKALCLQVRQRGIRRRCRNGSGRARNRGAAPITWMSHASKRSGRLPGFRKSTAAWSSAGSGTPHVSTHSLPSRPCISGSKD